MNNNNKKNINKSSCNRLISPVKSYGNAELFREVILKDNRGKSGIYRWVNNLNKKKICRFFSVFKQKICSIF
jgi:uncharacterized protein YbcV (DUF1398 family)